MKSYISRKLPLETRITDQMADFRFSNVTEPILTVYSAGVEACCEIPHLQVSMSAYRRIGVLITPSPTITRVQEAHDEQITGTAAIDRSCGGPDEQGRQRSEPAARRAALARDGNDCIRQKRDGEGRFGRA